MKSKHIKEEFDCYDKYESPIYRYIKTPGLYIDETNDEVEARMRQMQNTNATIKRCEDKVPGQRFQRDEKQLRHEGECLKQVLLAVRREALTNLLNREEREYIKAIQKMRIPTPPLRKLMLPPIPGLSIHANKPAHMRPPIILPGTPQPTHELYSLPPIHPHISIDPEKQTDERVWEYTRYHPPPLDTHGSRRRSKNFSLKYPSVSEMFTDVKRGPSTLTVKSIPAAELRARWKVADAAAMGAESSRNPDASGKRDEPESKGLVVHTRKVQ